MFNTKDIKIIKSEVAGLRSSVSQSIYDNSKTRDKVLGGLSTIENKLDAFYDQMIRKMNDLESVCQTIANLVSKPVVEMPPLLTDLEENEVLAELQPNGDFKIVALPPKPEKKAKRSKERAEKVRAKSSRAKKNKEEKK